jgi:hypothetical protein
MMAARENGDDHLFRRQVVSQAVASVMIRP